MAEYRNTFNNRIRESATPLGYPYVAVDYVGETEIAVRTADAILADVGADPALAQVALDRELSRETPRKVLTANLRKIIRDAEDE